MDKFTRIKVLGKGSFGQAVLVKDKKGAFSVIKEIDVSKMPKSEKEAAEQEVKVLMSLKHPNIVCCTDSFTERGKLCIVMDYCDGGDLYELLQKQKGKLVDEEQILDWFVQLCLAMKHVHDRKILHRDLKGQNVFMCAGGKMLKVGDFGVAKVLEGTMQLATTAVGTPYYLSPEICQGKAYNAKSDVWSLGCVLYEMVTLKHAFDASTLKLLVCKIIKGQYPAPPARYSHELRGLIDKMIRKDPRERPTVNEILAMPFIRRRIDSFLSETAREDEFSHTVLHGQRGLVPASGIAPPAQEKPKPKRAGALPSGGGGPGRRAAQQPKAGMPASAARAVNEARAKAERMAEERRKKDDEERRERAEEMRRKREESENRQRSEADRMRRERDDAERQLRAETERRAQEMAEMKLREIEERKSRDAHKREMERRSNEKAKNDFIARQQEAQRNRERVKHDAGPEVQIYMPEPSRQGRLVHASPAQDPDDPTVPRARDPTDDERRRIWYEAQEQAARNRRKAYDPPEPARGAQAVQSREYEPRAPASPAMSEQELAEERRRAYFEMQEAAKRNKQQVMGQIGVEGEKGGVCISISSEVPPAAQPSTSGAADADEGFEDYTQEWDDDLGEALGDLYTISEKDSGEYAAMLENMQDYLRTATDMVDVLQPEGLRSVHPEEAEAAAGEELPVISAPLSCLDGKFLLDGRTLKLPSMKNLVDESLATRVEALREFLEKELGDDAFIKVYRKMEDAKEDVDGNDDDAMHSIMEELGPGKVKYISLIHQLMVCEESMMAANAESP
ncbi:hypothetical protein CYMTET_7268 [Cymbomonas tetramitiformis]|uniref:non-specific serine/threonine protein kinase n=1 Tax=Cymbomonas tetramitiformis TaxID=36881 RepID=A0AAE0GVS5_9CHLO|nr:hypothetical protein CYMTET_7268 [Cymbomonas tetramitiformis]